MINKNIKKGIYLVLLAAVISGLANFFNKFGLEALGKNAYQYTTLKNIIAAIVLSLLVLTPLIWPKLKRLSAADWLKLFFIGLIGGSIPFLLFFKGLSLTSAVSAAFIHKTLFIWVAVLAWPILKEKLTRVQLLALLILLGGNLVFGGFKFFSWGYAHNLILIATIFWAIENIVAKKALKDLSSLTVASARMVFGSIMLLGLVVWQGNISMLSGLNETQWIWTLIASAFLSGYVLTWYTALKHAPATYVATLLVPATLVTNVLSAVFITHSMTELAVISGLFYITGTILAIYFAKKSESSLSPVLN